MSDNLIATFDLKEGDDACLVIARPDNNKGFTILKTFYGEEAIQIYDMLVYSDILKRNRKER